MINVDDVKSVAAALGGYSDDELEKYTSVIDCAVSVVSSMLNNEDLCSDARVIYLAAAKAHYDAVLISSCTDGITSFTAGDVSISESSASVEYARALLESARLDCAALIKDDSFAFLGV